MKLYIPRDREAHGIQIIGVKGTRKSSTIRRFVYQAYDRGWPCVFLDRKRDYLPEFHQPNDWLIDFGDKRGIRWMTSREAIDEPHAMPMAEGAYPDTPGRIFFFQDHARSIFSYLVGVHKPSTSQLAKMFAYPKLLDDAVKGTEHAETLSKNSPEQRQGILGTLNHLGRTLRWMPDEDGDREFSVTDWCKNRKGSIFLSSSPYTFPALRPLHSLIADMLLLGVQTYPGPALFVGDEFGVFNRCPQVEQGAAMIRSSGVVVILAYQGYAQLEHTYGTEMADSISSNNYTNIIFRTTSPKSAEYSSKILGMPSQIERVRESGPAHWWTRHHHNYSSERLMESPVTAGEIQSLEDGEGYMACAGRITKLRVDYLPPVIRAPRLIERIVEPVPVPTIPEPPAVPARQYRTRYTQKTLDLPVKH